MSDTTTEGIRVRVQCRYAPERSQPAHSRYFFVYTVTITNEGSEPAQLKTRHWIITDSNQRVEEVRGPGVVGETPTLRPGQSFTYSSGCLLRTPYGTMHGSYQMVRPDGRMFDAVIAPFVLAVPHAIN
ncbi:MAG: Co2+/Mg2+ efflux protein ApaG [Myxococcales bacterium]|nr:Co2+/Mg2+ efflux protein ApaG [Myxococcota bacterium]MDW8282140.1 Co2+/Mg2+ efflux protein ApaG [Myxococcales bacterium]